MLLTRPELKFLDAADERSFLRKLADLTASLLTLRVVDNRDYYILVNEDAVRVAEAIFKTHAVLTTRGSGLGTYQHLTLLPPVLGSVLRHFVAVNNERVEILDKSSGLRVKNVITPGNYLDKVEQMELGAGAAMDDGGHFVALSPIIALLRYRASKDGGVDFGVCFVDLFNKQLGVAEFLDNEYFGNLELCLLQLGVKECIVAPAGAKDEHGAKLRQLLDRIGMVCLEVGAKPPSDELLIEEDLLKLADKEHQGVVLTLSSGSTNVDTSKSAATATATSLLPASRLVLDAAYVLVQYLQLPSDDANLGVFGVVRHQLLHFVKLDALTVRALNVFPTPATQSSNPATLLLFGLLNKCKTLPGLRLLLQWLKQPLTDVQHINDRFDLVEVMVNDPQMMLLVTTEHLRAFPDLRKIVKKVGSASGSARAHALLEDMYKLYQMLMRLPELAECLATGVSDLEASGGDVQHKTELIDTHWSGPLASAIGKLGALQELVESTLDLEAVANNEFLIRPEFDEELVLVRQQMLAVQQQMEELHQQAGEDLGLAGAALAKKLKLEQHPQYGWCLRVTRTDLGLLRQTDALFIELSTVKAGVFFTTKQLRTALAELVELAERYAQKSSVLVKEVLDIVATYAPVLAAVLDMVAHLDVICAFAHVLQLVAPIPYTRPAVSHHAGEAGASVKLVASRHPLLELQDEVLFISNDIELARGEQEFLVITGPNMGGKSTYIRQLGCTVLMAQVGCFVPAESATVCVFDLVLLRVGALDLQLKGLSTFMAEMLETSNILRQATAHSLIIIDELGRGTSTYDGFGLAYAILEHIASKLHAFTLFATHFHELTLLLLEIATVKNYHVVAHVGDLGSTADDITLLYKVEPGILDQSFGIHVAEVVHFPPKIVNMAKRKAAELEEYQETGDAYVSDKRTKCLPAETQAGEVLLKEVLAEWKTALGESTDETTARRVLKEVVAARGDGFTLQPFIREIISML